MQNGIILHEKCDWYRVLYERYGCTAYKIEKLTNMKDLSVIFDSELSIRDHIQLKINKAYSICLLYTSDAADE